VRLGREWRAALALVVLLIGCERSLVTEVRGHPTPARRLRELTIGRATPADVESVFGPPDERAPDGALTYRSATVRRQLHRVAGWTLSASEQVEERTTTFRFTGGMLSKICRSRS
jgi:hypothetical protein